MFTCKNKPWLGIMKMSHKEPWAHMLSPSSTSRGILRGWENCPPCGHTHTHTTYQTLECRTDRCCGEINVEEASRPCGKMIYLFLQRVPMQLLATKAQGTLSMPLSTTTVARRSLETECCFVVMSEPRQTTVSPNCDE